LFLIKKKLKTLAILIFIYIEILIFNNYLITRLPRGRNIFVRMEIKAEWKLNSRFI